MNDDGNPRIKKSDGATYTTPSAPPRYVRPERRSVWSSVFKECRENPGEWRMVTWTFTRSTATQLASDIRNGHRRSPDKARVKGIQADDRFEARVGIDQSVPKESGKRWRLWIRSLGPDGADVQLRHESAHQLRVVDDDATLANQSAAQSTVTVGEMLNSDTDEVELMVRIYDARSAVH